MYSRFQDGGEGAGPGFGARGVDVQHVFQVEFGAGLAVGVEDGCESVDEDAARIAGAFDGDEVVGADHLLAGFSSATGWVRSRCRQKEAFCDAAQCGCHSQNLFLATLGPGDFVR